MLMLTKHQVEAVLYFVLFMADLNEPLGHSRVWMNHAKFSKNSSNLMPSQTPDMCPVIMLSLYNLNTNRQKVTQA